MKTQIYDPVLHGQVPLHLQAAVLLAGGRVDKITMMSAQHSRLQVQRLTLGPHWALPAGLVDGKTDGAWVLYVGALDELVRERYTTGEQAVVELLRMGVV